MRVILCVLCGSLRPLRGIHFSRRDRRGIHVEVAEVSRSSQSILCVLCGSLRALRAMHFFHAEIAECAGPFFACFAVLCALCEECIFHAEIAEEYTQRSQRFRGVRRAFFASFALLCALCEQCIFFHAEVAAVSRSILCVLCASLHSLREIYSGGPQ
jgi:hypothetical protein